MRNYEANTNPRETFPFALVGCIITLVGFGMLLADIFLDRESMGVLTPVGVVTLIVGFTLSTAVRVR